jgi:hypothetical protein
MALGDNYVTLAQLKDYMANELPSTDDDELNDAIASASREVERFCKRQFNDSGAVTSRLYHPLDCESCFVDDFHTTTGLVVKIDEDDDGVFETTLTSADYELHPVNGTMAGVPGWPYWDIQMVGDHTFTCKKRSTVQVTAKWGWAAVPALVHQACLELASSTFGLRSSRLGVAGSDQFGSIIRVSDNRLAFSKLANYRKRSIECM